MQSSAADGASGTAARLWRLGGLAPFYTALGATVVKHSAHSCVYYAGFQLAQRHAREWLHSTVRGDLAAGFLAGVAAGTVNNPFDVVKSRQQAHAHRAAPSSRDSSVFAGIVQIARREGASTLFTGWGAKVARLGPGSAIIFAVYHAIKERLDEAARP